MACPFCGWDGATGEYEMLLHIETLHSEGESPFLVKEDNSSDTRPASEDAQYVECPVDACAELLLLQELDYHLQLHDQESVEPGVKDGHSQVDRVAPALEQESRAASPNAGFSRARREAERRGVSNHDQPTSGRQVKALSALMRLLKMPSSSSTHKLVPKRRHDGETSTAGPSSTRGRRLGRAHLGKYAHEDRMPDWLMSLLKREGQIASEGVVPVIAQLLEASSSTKYAYLCSPSVQHVSKLKREGGFCGYRNIQMMASYIIDAKSKGHENFGNKIPTIFQIQDWIEAAWDRGINAQGRLETGGIRGTRKYIGTPEALAVFRLLNIPCDALGIRDREPGKSEKQLLEYVEGYFQSGVEDPTQRVRRTKLPPLYFQHIGHSLTIIGFEKLKNGSDNLIVFDPSFHDASYILRLVGRTFVHPTPELALMPYRRGNSYLKTYREFEILRLRTDKEGKK
ncbi:hypothetical protein VTK26DRAFT_7322 [Humicola hyalothermophila]